MIDFNNAEEVKNKLSELKAEGLSHMTIERFNKINEILQMILNMQQKKKRRKEENCRAALSFL